MRLSAEGLDRIAPIALAAASDIGHQARECKPLPDAAAGRLALPEPGGEVPRAEVKERVVGMIEDAKETVGAAAKHVGRAVEDGVDATKDRIAEAKADAEVKRAEAEQKSVQERNAAKERMRD